MKALRYCKNLKLALFQKVVLMKKWRYIYVFWIPLSNDFSFFLKVSETVLFAPKGVTLFYKSFVSRFSYYLTDHRDLFTVLMQYDYFKDH